jgi:hypothetical protein
VIFAAGDSPNFESDSSANEKARATVVARRKRDAAPSNVPTGTGTLASPYLLINTNSPRSVYRVALRSRTR